METKHTPGPWTKGKGKVRVRTESGTLVAECYTTNRSMRYPRDSEEREANATLIAAAPELLEALEGFVREFDCKPIDCRYLIDAARAAIAKATE